MKQIETLFLIIVLFTKTINGQELSLKQQALNEFKNEHYQEAIILLEKAFNTTTVDAETYYYLGVFNHYKAYDSRPLTGHNFSNSEKIFAYFDKAIELNPNFGNAKYFYGAECSGNSFLAMQNYDLEKLKYFYKLAFDKGAYPEWLLEYGKNMLNSCNENAILFTGGNADFDVCSYLQLHQNYRTDITIIPIGYIDRPWYVKFLKEGLKGAVKKINLELTDNQIYDIHPYKWKKTNIQISVTSKLKQKYELDSNYLMEWIVEPNLKNENKRTYLSPQKAMLLQIVENNYDERPIYFSNSSNKLFYGGLDEYFKNCGIVSELTPIKTKHTKHEYDYNKINKLIKERSFKNYYKIKETDIPRISKSISFDYYSSFYNLSEYYYKSEDKEKYNEVVDIFESTMMVDYYPDYEKLFLSKLKIKADKNVFEK